MIISNAIELRTLARIMKLAGLRNVEVLYSDTILVLVVVLSAKCDGSLRYPHTSTAVIFAVI